MANKKFEELMKQLEEEMAKAPKPQPKAPKAPVQEKVKPGLVLKGPVTLVPKPGPTAAGPSMAKQFAANPKAAEPKITEVNAAAIALMTGGVDVPYDKWLVQVYPDESHVIHFQAKLGSSQYYVRWYEVVSPEKWKELSDVYHSSSASLMRGSFYGSGKKYLICSRIGDSLVDIPGFGTMEVPGLFGIGNELTQVVPIPEEEEEEEPEEEVDDLDDKEEEDVPF